MKHIDISTYKVNPEPDLINDDQYEFITNVFHLAGLYELLAINEASNELSFGQIKILSMINSGICTRSSQLALHFNVSKANMTGMVSRLEKSGYIERKEFEDDYRVKILALTEKGKSFVETNRPNFFNLIKKPFEGINSEKVIHANEALSHCIETLRKQIP